ncbi:MAG: hypothetical protein ACTHMV_13450 [Chitinophagaceae bacterium]
MNQDVLQIKKADAVTAYKAGSAADKKLLTNLFPEQFGDLTERNKTFQDVLDEKRVTMGDILPVVPAAIKHLEKHIHAYAKLCLIKEVFAPDFEPDWSNSNQYKYYPWFEHKSGVGLSYLAFDHRRSDADVAARLCYPTSALAIYVGKTFEDIYRDYLTF